MATSTITALYLLKVTFIKEVCHEFVTLISEYRSHVSQIRDTHLWERVAQVLIRDFCLVGVNDCILF